MQHEERRGTRPTASELQETVDDFNRKYAVGSPVVVWPGERRGEGIHTKTKTKAMLLGGHTPVVWVEDHPACIALSHVQPYNE